MDIETGNMIKWFMIYTMTTLVLVSLLAYEARCLNLIKCYNYNVCKHACCYYMETLYLNVPWSVGSRCGEGLGLHKNHCTQPCLLLT